MGLSVSSFQTVYSPWRGTVCQFLSDCLQPLKGDCLPVPFRSSTAPEERLSASSFQIIYSPWRGISAGSFLSCFALQIKVNSGQFWFSCQQGIYLLYTQEWLRASYSRQRHWVPPPLGPAHPHSCTEHRQTGQSWLSLSHAYTATQSYPALQELWKFCS